MHYYNIYIGGYGGEVCWHSISKDAYNYFNENNEMLTEHILNENNDVPDYADLTDNGSKTWDELDNIDHEYYCDYYSAHITIEETDKFGKSIGNVVEWEELEKFVEENDIETEFKSAETIKEPYYVQIFSAEKGSFWDCAIISDKEFDKSKLKIIIQESINENDGMIQSILYDGIDLDNNGGDTRGKGIDVHLLEN